MSHWIIYALFIYIIYKIVKGVVFPAIHITNTVNGKMREMQDRMKDMEHKQQQNKERHSRKKEGEYIDYEEVK
jgi:hypothetical protein